jgi:hypothetical protein
VSTPSRSEVSPPLVSDQQVLLDVLTRFSRMLAGRYDVSDVLYELSDVVAEVLDAAGVGVSLRDEQGHLRFATATSELVTTLERIQQDFRQGPCHFALFSPTKRWSWWTSARPPNVRS